MATITARKRIWGWYFFDWASQPYHTVLNTFIFGPFFAAIAASYFLGLGLEETAADARAQATWAWSTAIYGIIIALAAPIFGAMADSSGRKMPWIIGFSIMYIVGASLLWFTDPDAGNLYWMLAAFGLGFIGGEYALIFINSQLPGLGERDEIGKISGSGFAFGYLGGVVCLILVLGFVVEQGNGKTLLGFDPVFGLNPAAREGTRLTGPLTALWFAVFMVPYFLWVREVRTSHLKASFSAAIKSVVASVKGLAHRKSLGIYLVSSMLYRDGLNGLYTFGGVYANLVLDWEVAQIGAFGVVAAIGASFFSFIGGFADRRFGPKPVIIAAIWVLIFVCLTIVNLTPNSIYGIALEAGSHTPDLIFMVCGVLIGGFGGILQSSSRSLMVRHCTTENATEYFGLYGLSGRATAFLAPILIGIVTTLTGSARIGISPVIILFILGLILLAWVKRDGDFAK
ncbi:MFS transporter [Sulfitobacter sp. M57]|uniref:MFS transporter n=1 Tax=unclassified Sulfitobacter TaxID=196795 RepID=UPI0023E2B72C|nr:MULTISPECIES: MFS transporter [unclassified Sulfitobacter]MDF3415252.1 MFS transporter [Sulfitobacter sp. KE5]MDF3422733.1 MFS transporter [Sulfitobacter sp. KE43]MDF3433798.1 MFS transporter [Sulfitobacter sp. KE42]MDF3459438.1 MFS transporter [Sulfitobacter sp. S74]MDF3463337.1 MFS transporter [Sulfitobacter sp. Ks18]